MMTIFLFVFFLGICFTAIADQDIPLNNAYVAFSVDFEQSGEKFKSAYEAIVNYSIQANLSSVSRTTPKDQLAYIPQHFDYSSKADANEVLNKIAEASCDGKPLRIRTDFCSLQIHGTRAEIVIDDEIDLAVRITGAVNRSVYDIYRLGHVHFADFSHHIELDVGCFRRAPRTGLTYLNSTIKLGKKISLHLCNERYGEKCPEIASKNLTCGGEDADVNPPPRPTTIGFKIDFDKSGARFQQAYQDLLDWAVKTNQSQLQQILEWQRKAGEFHFNTVSFWAGQDSRARQEEFLKDLGAKLCDFAPFRLPISLIITRNSRVYFTVQPDPELIARIERTLMRHGLLIYPRNSLAEFSVDFALPSSAINFTLPNPNTTKQFLSDIQYGTDIQIYLYEEVPKTTEYASFVFGYSAPFKC